MKLLLFVTEDAVADAAIDALVEQGFRVTRLASSGGFLRRGNTTILAGVEDTAVTKAQQTVSAVAEGTLCIVLDLERYERM